ncbi:hypothetical protein [Pedobacter namyangjuensis]|uniref:hypothetical protein n=1 Tax=Pedobacter namyangjuensis TaxID=600626 RepID=UPI000DE44CA3|nr:hypothetical protein [Pedobacter namyangjuensis]
MKKIHVIIGFITIMLATSCRFNNENQSIQVVVTEGTYVFEAKYPKEKTERVVNYIEKVLNDDSFFASDEGEKSGAVVLNDGKNFRVKSSPGFLEIEFRKKENSETNYKELVKLCSGVKEQLK